MLLAPAFATPDLLGGRSSALASGGHGAGRVGGLTGISRDSRDPDVYYRLGYAGICDGQAKLFGFLLDDSGSVTSAGGNDPLSRRYGETRLAVTTLAEACRCGREAVAVIHWDVGRHDVPPVVIRGDTTRPWFYRPAKSLSHVLGGLRQPADAAGTSCLAPALAEAEQLVQRVGRNGVASHLIVLSDFELLDTDPDDVFTRLAGFAGQPDCQVTAVALGKPADRVDSRLNRPGIQVLPLTAADPPGALAHALFGQLTAGRSGRQLITPTQPSGAGRDA